MKAMIPIRISVRRKTAAASLSAVVCGALEISFSLMERNFFEENIIGHGSVMVVVLLLNKENIDHIRLKKKIEDEKN
ncbi:hypothetical protein L6452_18718 [Arctium lappa]|uniref:Uncharacterized protein n=1 Tax=Arctium lappa TaxID=4217 RepID=A0ACB9C6Y3_ARCLA|nr:hypothetical protein L6452_18718 [Arctium lappa]